MIKGTYSLENLQKWAFPYDSDSADKSSLEKDVKAKLSMEISNIK